MNPELPVVEGVGALPRGGFPRCDLQSLRWKRLRAQAPDSGLICDVFDLPDKTLQLVKVGAGQLDSGILWYRSSEFAF